MPHKLPAPEGASHEESDARRSEERLWRLVADRTRADADVGEIDRRIWDLFGEEWSILVTDLAGFSRQVAAFGIVHFLQIIYEHRRMLLPIAVRHDGVLVKCEADSLILLFRQPLTAVRCAIEMQRTCEQVNQRRKPEEQILLCVGIGYGRVLRVGDDEVFGQEVNAASKLGEDTASAGEILVTEAVRAELDAADLEFSELGIVAGGSPRNYRVVAR